MQQGKKIICNSCGRILHQQNGQLTEDFFHMEKNWGYFSGQDGILQRADICEDCMKRWMMAFQIPPETVERTEIFEC